MSDAPTPEVDSVWLDSFRATGIDAEKVRDFARRLERERDELRARVAELEGVLKGMSKAFPDLAEFQDKNGFSLAPLAARVAKALTKKEANHG